jgi:hypothetical protein
MTSVKAVVISVGLSVSIKIHPHQS